jgi:2-keto-4-pentenoate hydratase/2-oxohepta-3-ene-1,7-dioic acid hydratase in catechol pathway
MKFLSFVRKGVAGYGAIVEGGIVDLTGRVQGVLSLKEAIARNLLAEAAGMAADMGPGLASSDVTLLPVVPDPGKILCIGLNYEKHRTETKRPEASYPAVFVRFADSQVAHHQPIVKPNRSDRLDYEGELAVIIGRGGRNIPEANAIDHVAGWSCYNDGSIRDYQRHTHQFTPGKTFPGTGAFGPYMMTPDEAGDHTSWPIETRLNGDVMQQATLSDLIFPIPRIIAYLSEFTPLSAGDVILTGTPGGVGDRREPPVFMKNGDLVEVEIGPLGTLINPVCDEV